jgi:tetratricopeptide (TPR) repeat protein
MNNYKIIQDLKLHSMKFVYVLILLNLAGLQALAQDDIYNNLNKDYQRLKKEQKLDSALLVTKQMNTWALKNETDTSLRYAVSYRDIGNCFYALNNNDSAICYYNYSLKYLKKQLRQEHPDYAETLNNLGNLYNTMGDYKYAEPYYKQALEIRKKALGEEHPKYASSLNNLGNLYKTMGDYKSAELYLKQSLEIKKKALGEEHPDYASSLNNLGILYKTMGDYKSAELYLKQSLEIIKKAWGEEHPKYASSLNNLGILYDKMGDYKSAELYLKQSLEIRKKALGEEHPDYAETLNNLGNLYDKMGDYKGAELYYKQSVEIKKKALGEEHPKYASSLNNLGELYKTMGDYKSAELYLKQSLEIIKKALGEEHPIYASSLNNLGNLYDKMGDYKYAELYYKQSVEIRKKALGEEHPDYAETLNNLGELYKTMGDYKYAEPYYKQALEIRKKALGEEHPDYASSFKNIADLYSKTNRTKEALSIYNTCFAILNKNISVNFEWLNDNEKELLWKKNNSFYNDIDNFVSANVIKLPELAGLSYNSNLFTKSKLLETTINKDNYYTEIQEIRERLSFLRKKIDKLDDNDALNYKKLVAEADSLDTKLTQSWPAYAQQKKNLSITWDQVQANLSNDEAAIEFVRFKSDIDSNYHYNALIIRKNDVNPILVNLCNEKQLKEIGNKEGFSAYYPLVWAPLEAYLTGIKTIYYSPTGLLYTVPFHALYAQKDKGDVVSYNKKTRQLNTTAEENAAFLSDKYTLHQLTSTRYLAMGLKEKSNDKIPTSIALVGAVNYDYLPTSTKTSLKNKDYASRGSNAIGPLPYLEGTKTEVETINKTLNKNGWESVLIEGNEATEENIEKLENQNSKGVLHIATHGFAFAEPKGMDSTINKNSAKYYLSYNKDPLKRSGLILAGANWAWIGSDEFKKLNPDAEDGILTASSVSLLNLRKTKLVVLSACETGLGKIEGSEGVFGLKRAFKLAGVEQIIVSLWEVPDNETMELMTLFYDDLAKTQNPIVSFEKAQKTMKNNYPTRPDLWAGFVLVR